MDHFKNPRNMGELQDADGVGEVGNLKCGDMMRVFIRIKTRKIQATRNLPAGKAGKKQTEKYISGIKFQTLGCAAAIAASSMMTELVKGKSIEEAKNISRDDINDSLGKLPAQKYHCSILSANAIRKAIEDYTHRSRSPQ